MSQRLTEQAAETASRFRVALGERLLEDARTRARQQAVPSVRTVLREGDPAAAILNVAREGKRRHYRHGTARSGRPGRALARQRVAQSYSPR